MGLFRDQPPPGKTWEGKKCWSNMTKDDVTLEERKRRLKKKLPKVPSLPKKPEPPNGEIFYGTKRFW